MWRTLEEQLGSKKGLISRKFNFLRWFSILSFVFIASVAVALAVITTRFVVKETIERDAMLTAQFVKAIAIAEARHMRIPNIMSVGELLDPRQDARHLNATQEQVSNARNEYLDHISHLPDALLASVYATDKTIVWSTNPELIGRQFYHDDLEKAFQSRSEVSASFHEVVEGRGEQKFLRPPQSLVVENYIPLLNAQGEVVTMVEIYKEPADLIARIKRGYVVVWLTSAAGGAFIYFGLYWIVRRAAVLLETQQQQLIASETFVALGEMSSSVAHSLRNPLATIRSSAELAQELAPASIRTNIDDIISQVDRMSKWVRDMLLSSSPYKGGAESVDVTKAVDETLHDFNQQLRHMGVQVKLDSCLSPPVMVLSHRILLAQVLNSLIANAIEAMPKGGELGIKLQHELGGKHTCLTISDTGRGMSSQQKSMLFKPFYTTKQGGLGVGLVMVKRIMERFGGTVSLSSFEQEGTQVVLSFLSKRD